MDIKNILQFVVKTKLFPLIIIVSFWEVVEEYAIFFFAQEEQNPAFAQTLRDYSGILALIVYFLFYTFYIRLYIKLFNQYIEPSKRTFGSVLYNDLIYKIKFGLLGLFILPVMYVYSLVKGVGYADAFDATSITLITSLMDAFLTPFVILATAFVLYRQISFGFIKKAKIILSDHRVLFYKLFLIFGAQSILSLGLEHYENIPKENFYFVIKAATTLVYTLVELSLDTVVLVFFAKKFKDILAIQKTEIES